jgi:hypothetical protein
MQQEKLTESNYYGQLRKEYKSLSARYQQESILRFLNLKMKPTDDPISGCYGLSSFFSVLDFLTVSPTKIYVREDGSYRAVNNVANMFTIYSRFLMSGLEELLSRHSKNDGKRIMFLAAPLGMGKTHLTRLFLAYSMKLKKDEDINQLEMQSSRGVPVRFEIDYFIYNKDFEKLESLLGSVDNKKISLLAFRLRDSLGWNVFDFGKKMASKLRKITRDYRENFLMIIPASPLDIAYLEKFEREFLDENALVVLIANYKENMLDLIERRVQYISSSYESDYSFLILEKMESIRENITSDLLESSAIAKLRECCRGNPAIALKLLERSFEITSKKGERLVSEETIVEASVEMKLNLDEYQIGIHTTRERAGVGRANYLISLLGSSSRRAGAVSKITGSSVARISTLFRDIEGLQKKGRVYSFTDSLLALLEEEIIEKIVNEDIDEFTVFNNLQKELNTEGMNDLSKYPKGVGNNE